jgi:hypothetical protein
MTIVLVLSAKVRRNGKVRRSGYGRLYIGNMF